MVEIMRRPRIIRETARGLETMSLEDDFFQKREIFLTTGIEAEVSTELIKQLLYLNSMDPMKEITLYINSPGGEINSGIALYDCLCIMQAPVRTVCIGIAASMGALIFLAGDRRAMLPHTKLMIHDPYYAGGPSNQKPLEMEKRLQDLMKIRDTICEIISERTGKEKQKVQEITQYDSYFDAHEALVFGLATEIVELFE